MLALTPVAAAERVWIPGWREAAPMTMPRAGAAIVTAGDRVYAIGGIDGRRFLKAVEFARILPDGSLTPWEPTAPINEERGFFDAAVLDGYIYIAGGGNGEGGKNLLRSVERAPIRPDGRLGSWETLEVNLNYPRRCAKLALHGRSLYAIGGFGGVLHDSVERAEILPDGRLGPFRLEPNPTTIPRYVNTVAAGADILYVLGGHSETEGNGIAGVEFARPGGNGEALGWREAAPMMRGRYALSSVLLGGELYALGGLDGPVYMDSVETGSLGGEGAPHAWRANTALSSPRANFGAFAHGDRLYVVGGANREGYYRSVEYAERGPDGELGFWATAEEAAEHARRLALAELISADQPALPNEGTVREVLQAGIYTYVKVTGAGGEIWIAGPQGEYSPGDTIRYSSGTPMSDFHSRSLGRSFEHILFVEDMAPAESR